MGHVMRHRVARISAPALGTIFGLLAGLTFGTAWSQPGTVHSHLKISDTQGNFTAVLDDLDEFGGAVANLGDLDGPGPSMAAVAVGAIGDDDGGTDHGAVYVLFLDATGQILSHQKISSTEGNFTALLDAEDEFGAAVASLGDLDGPGPSVAALAVGATGDDDGGTNRGAVYVLFLNSTGTVLSYQKISDTQGNFAAPLHTLDELGGALAYLGDLDASGPSVAALAVGAIGDDDGGTDRGAVYVLFLESTGNVHSYQKISDTEGNFSAPLTDLGELGSSAANLGDLDGPGPSVAALAVGAIGDTAGGTHRGAVYVLFLNGGGSVLGYQKISDTEGNFMAPLEDFDEFGSAVTSCGDLDGPGPSIVALAVGAIGDDDGGTDRGAVYVLFLDGTGSVLSYQKISDTTGNFNGKLGDGDDFGGAVCALGDMDGQGVSAQTLMVGAAGDDDGGTNRGATYVLFLAGNPPASVSGPRSAISHLGSASPNPFYPGTRIPFTLGEDSWVRIDVCDARGRLVRRLVHGNAIQGRHDAVWDGCDDSGHRAAPGIYFYRMSQNGRLTSAKKAILLN